MQQNVNLEERYGVLDSSKKRTKLTILSTKRLKVLRIVSFIRVFLDKSRTPKLAFEISQ
mgnify:CR=1 FL=1